MIVGDRRRWLSWTVVAVAAVAAVAGVVACRASREPTAVAAANGESAAVGISADGRRIAFVSSASNVVPGERRKAFRLFVYDRVSGSVQQTDLRPRLASGALPVLTPDFRFVAYSSRRPGGVDYELCFDIFVLDRLTGKTEQVDVNSKGAPGAMSEDRECSDGYASISADGRFVAFASASSDLVAGDINRSEDVFVRDLLTRTTERVGVTTGGGPMTISADGRLLVYVSQLESPDGATREGLSVHDRLTKTTRRLLLPYGSAWTGYYGLSVTEFSDASGFIGYPVDRRSRAGRWLGSELFVLTPDGHRERVAVTTPGSLSNAGMSVADINSNGRFVLFTSTATNLLGPSSHSTCITPAEYNGAGVMRSPATRGPCPNLYLADRTTGKVELITPRRAGRAAAENSTVELGAVGTLGRSAFVSPDGRFIAFTSPATNLVADIDTNKVSDVFLRDRQTRTTTLISAAR